MKINCVGCSNFTFELELDPTALRNQPVIALTCPKCGSSTAIQQRDGGGIQIALDKHLENKRKAR